MICSCVNETLCHICVGDNTSSHNIGGIGNDRGIGVDSWGNAIDGNLISRGGIGRDLIGRGVGGDLISHGIGDVSISGGVGNNSINCGIGNGLISRDIGNNLISRGMGDGSISRGIGDDSIRDIGNNFIGCGVPRNPPASSPSTPCLFAVDRSGHCVSVIMAFGKLKAPSINKIRDWKKLE